MTCHSSDVIHDITTMICIITQDNSVTYDHVHPRPGARVVCFWGGGHKKFLGGTFCELYRLTFCQE